MGKGHHHGGHHGGRRRFGRSFGTVDVVDSFPDYVTSDCYRELLPDGSFVWRCPERIGEAMGYSPEYLRVSDTMGAGDILPTFVTPDDARKAIDETDAGYERMNIAILGSSTPPEFKASWGLQYAGWKTFATGARATVGFLNTKAVMDQNDRYQSQLADWNKSFALVGGKAPGPAPADPGQGVPDKNAASFLSGSTGLVLAGAALAAILVFGPRFSKG